MGGGKAVKIHSNITENSGPEKAAHQVSSVRGWERKRKAGVLSEKRQLFFAGNHSNKGIVGSEKTVKKIQG